MDEGPKLTPENCFYSDPSLDHKIKITLDVMSPGFPYDCDVLFFLFFVRTETQVGLGDSDKPRMRKMRFSTRPSHRAMVVFQLPRNRYPGS